MIAPGSALSVARQAKLLGVSRSSVYYRPRPDSQEELDLLKRLDELFTENPVYGSRRLQQMLKREGVRVGRRRIRRLMRKLGLWAVGPKPDTSKPHPEHKVYPYLLRGLNIERPNHVWATDITYIRMRHGFLYLCAILDWATRKVLAWRLSNTLTTDFCTAALKEALARYGTPEIFNTDQGCQFTSAAFTGVLKANDIAISMDGRGRALDNIFVERLWRSVKHEDVYLKGYATLPELRRGMTEYFVFYNTERTHQSLDYRTPDEVYRTARGGGASIVDKFTADKEIRQEKTASKTGAAPCSCVSKATLLNSMH